jgi:hypothetical protein
LLLEIISCSMMGGILTYTYADKHALNDAKKIQHITKNCGLTADEGGKVKTIHLLRKSRHSWGMTYVYRIPLGLAADDFQRKKTHIEDGLNHTRGIFDVSLEDLRRLKWDGDILTQIKRLLSGTKQRKEILMDYDGTLRISVYREPLAELIPFDDTTLDKCTGWCVFIGESREGTVYHDFDKIQHMIVAGTQRYGKTVFLKSVITTLIHNHSEQAKFTLIDLKGGLAFNRFVNMKQVNTVAKDVDESLEALRMIHEEIKQRQKEFLRKGYEDITEAKYKHRHFTVIDEAAEIASHGESDPQIKKKKTECEHIIAEIARIGGGLGYRLIFATQYPTADILPRQVKQNAIARVCFFLTTDTASQVVLDESGAEELPLIKGRAIYRTDRKYIVQTPFIENGFIDNVIRPHIVFKPRKENDTFANSAGTEDTTRRKHTLVIEKA